MQIESQLNRLRLYGMSRSWQALLETRKCHELSLSEGLEVLRHAGRSGGIERIVVVKHALALDVVRRWVWNLLRRMDLPGHAKQLKNCRYALWKNPEDLTDRQNNKLAWIARHNQQLYRAYLLKEHLRLVFAHRGGEAVARVVGERNGFCRCTERHQHHDRAEDFDLRDGRGR